MEKNMDNEMDTGEYIGIIRSTIWAAGSLQDLWKTSHRPSFYDLKKLMELSFCQDSSNHGS